MRIKMGRRLVWLGVAILLILGALGGRVYNLQIVKGADYARMAFNQRTLSLPIGTSRGLILDRHGKPISDPQPLWGVAIFPPLVTDPEGEARALANLLGLDEATVRKSLKGGRSATWLGGTITADLAAQVQGLGLAGVAVGPRESRFGPGALAGHLVGYLNTSGGQLGLERAFEQELAGEAIPALVATLDGHDQPLSGLGIRTVVPTAGKPPYTLFTTLDGDIQRAVERVMADRKVKSGAAVVLDPASGEVLAIASRPSLDYAHLAEMLADESRTDHFLTDRAVSPFAPGSVFKAFVAAEALESGAVTPDEEFYCPGHYEIGGHLFTEEGGGHGWITFAEAVARSCNVTFLKVGYERLGADALRTMALRFGFGSPTNLLGVGRAWEGEQPGYVPTTDQEGVLQIAFGQGELATTPLQVARAFAAIANGGSLPPLRLVTAIKNPAGEVVDRPEAGGAERVISQATASALQQALLGVTDPRGGGTGKQAWIAEVGSAGKTGTAEGGASLGGASELPHAWFAGYLPTVAPRYVIVVFVEHGGYGGEVAAPIFREIGQAILDLPSRR